MRLCSSTAAERGLVSVIVAVSFLALFVVAAMVIDLGIAPGHPARLPERGRLGSLAGANMLYPKSNACTITTSQTVAALLLRRHLGAVKNYATPTFSTTAAQWSSCLDPDKDLGGYNVTGESPCITFFGQTAPYSVTDSTTAPYKVRVRVPAKTFKTGLGSRWPVSGRSRFAPATPGPPSSRARVAPAVSAFSARA